jgi:NAD(P)-dependent dehydrogenase (short-subunit alcohol dehydrogenase family)
MTSLKSAVITGANKGIGREVARRLAADGFKVWLGARDAERGRRAASELRAEGLAVQWLELDVTSDTSVAVAVKAVRNESSQLDVLVNNAGVAINYDSPPSEQALVDIKTT